jgi:large subunit ribosomal protein L4
MPTITVKKQTGEESGSLELNSSVFGAEHHAVLVREVYNAYMANQRQGTHSVKTRTTVRGGGAKPWKQKGTGRARQGSIRSPQWRGGAIAHGPSPRDYREKINKKKKSGAYRALLSAKLANNEIIVVDTIDFSGEPKTRKVVEFLESLGIAGKTLIVTNEKNDQFLRAVSNLKSSASHPTKAQVVNAVSIFDLLTCETLVIEKAALETLQERLQS